MGCLWSKLYCKAPASTPVIFEIEHANSTCDQNGQQIELEAVSPFREFFLDLLRRATNSFSIDQIVSNNREKALNFVYKGKLDHNRRIAIKRFSKAAWPDAKGFMKRNYRMRPGRWVKSDSKDW